MQGTQNFELKISDSFYKKIYTRWLNSENRESLMHPDDAKTNPAMIMAELLTIILDASYSNKKLSNAHFAEMYPKALQGRNPFHKDDMIRTAGVKPELFEAVLSKLRGEELATQ